MSTEIYLASDVFSPAFSFDADLSWDEAHELEVTTHKVEGKGTISDHLATKPFTATVEGKVTAMVLDGPANPQKLVNVRDELEKLSARRELVIVQSGLYSGELAITRVNITQTAQGGKSLSVKISLRRMEITTVGTAQVPASKLRPKVIRRAAPKKSGGATSAKKPPGSYLVRGVDAGKAALMR